MLTALLSLALAAADFAGSAQCAPCHRAQYDKQRLSHHAGSLAPILKSALPQKLAGHTVRESNGLAFTYATAPNGLSVSVTRGAGHSSATLEWAFGAGVQGITPVGRIGGSYFEHRVSWYPKEGRAGLTIGHHADAPAPIAEALGQPQSAGTISRCFNCHATGVKSGPDLSGMRPGIECERCHGPGRRHMESPSAKSIVNPGRLSPRAVVESCGECHRLPASGAASRTPELENPESIRFAPIGLMASRCFQASGRMSCLTCHYPHEDARQDAEFYAEKCLGCHTASATAMGSQCRRATSRNCLPCHMPKSSPIPFLEFTDHRIRIIAASSPIETQVKARLLASRRYDEQNDPARAVSEAQAAIELDPRNLAARLQLAQIFLSHNTPEPALEIFSDALRIAPDSLVARLGKGLALKELQRFDEAVTELTACLDRDPRMGLAFDALASLYLQTSEYAKLSVLSQQYLQRSPSDYRGYYYLAAAKEREKDDNPGAEQLLRRSLELNPNFAASYALLGKLLTEDNRLDEAVRELERAIQLRPDYPPAHLYLGNAYRKLGRDTDSTSEFELLRRINEQQRSRPSLVYHRGGPKQPL